MGTNNVLKPVENEFHMESFFNYIKENGIFVRTLDVDYRRGKDKLIIYPEGISSMSLSNEFMDMVKNQFEILEEKVIVPLMGFLESDFTINIEVDNSGQFGFDSIKIIINPRFRRDQSLNSKIHSSYRHFSRFLEHIESISVQGRSRRIANIYANLVLSMEDLHEILEFPVVSPKFKKQWLNFITEADEELQNYFSIDIKIPCFEGEILWKDQNKQMKLHHLVKNAKVLVQDD